MTNLMTHIWIDKSSDNLPRFIHRLYTTLLLNPTAKLFNIGVDTREKSSTAFTPRHNTNLTFAINNGTTGVTLTGVTSSHSSTEHVWCYHLCSVQPLTYRLQYHGYWHSLENPGIITTFLCVAPPRNLHQLACLNSVLVEFNWLHLFRYDKWFRNLQEITKKTCVLLDILLHLFSPLLCLIQEYKAKSNNPEVPTSILIVPSSHSRQSHMLFFMGKRRLNNIIYWFL